jgi:Glycosyl transferase family 2
MIRASADLLSPIGEGHKGAGDPAIPLRIGVVIPAAACPCPQVERVRCQLAASDRLVVVWNGPPGKHDCASLVASDPSCHWVETTTRLGSASARNLGVRTLEEAARVVAFADSDDRVMPSWLESLTRPLLDGSADVVGGVLRTQWARQGTTILPCVDYWHAQALFGGNLAMTGEAWQMLAGFDSRFGCCEDTDLAWRAAAAQLRVGVVLAAVVEVDLPSILVELRQRLRWGKWAVQLLAEHELGSNHLPSLRDLLAHKRSMGYCRHPSVAAIGQWVGQSSARFASHASRPTGPA